MKKGRYTFDYSRLYGYMKEKGFTQDKLARLSGVSLGTINQNMKNGRAFRVENIVDISQTLNIGKENLAYYFFKTKP